MKKFLMLFAMVVMGFLAMAQTNPKMSYQAVVRDNNNRLAANEPCFVVVTIGSFTQTASPTANANGLISVVIPSDALQAEFNLIDWSTIDSIETKVTINSLGQTVTSKVPVTSVPTSLYSKAVDPAVLAPYAKIAWVRDTLNSYVDKLKYTADSTAVYAKIKADSTVLGGKIKNNADSIKKILEVYLPDTAAALRTALADTAKELRKDLKSNDSVLTLTYNKGAETLGTFSANADHNKTIDIPKSTFTHAEEVDSVKNFIGAANLFDMQAILAAQKANTDVWSALRDSIAVYVIDYLAAEMMKDTNNMTLLKKVIDQYKVVAPTLGHDDAKYYINRAKEIRDLTPAAVKEDIKNEIKYRAKELLKSTEFQNEVTSILNDPDVKNAILNNAGVKSIVIELINTTDVQNAIKSTLPHSITGTITVGSNPPQSVIINIPTW